MAYFTVVSMLLAPLLHLPLMIGFLSSLLTSRYWGQELLFLLLFTAVPLVVVYMVHCVAKVIKNQKLFLMFTFLLLAGVSYFNFTIPFVLDNPGNAIRLLVGGLGWGLFTSIVLTNFWKRIFLLKKTDEAKLLEIPLLLVTGILVVEWFMMVTVRTNLLLEVYIAGGELLKPLVNIFYLDFYGFVGLFLSLVASVSSMVLRYISPRR